MAVIPALDNNVRSQDQCSQKHRHKIEDEADLQDTETHANGNANLLVWLHLEVPYQLPRKDGEDEVHGSRIR